jgi:hypothetical protein
MIHTNVAFMQAKNCAMCIHIGSAALTFGSAPRPFPLLKLELLTPTRWFRLCVGPLHLRPRWGAR